MIDWKNAPEWADRWAIATTYGAPIWYNATKWQYAAGGQVLSIADCGFGELDFKSLHIRPGTNRKESAPTPDGIAQKIVADAPRNKYDRVIHGKYGTGSVTVDVYRVLNAFGPLSPEIDHAVKKLLAAGSRGHKDERQDLLEAIQSIEARLQYLEAVGD